MHLSHSYRYLRTSGDVRVPSRVEPQIDTHIRDTSFALVGVTSLSIYTHTCVYLSLILIGIFAPPFLHTRTHHAWCRGIRIISVYIYLSIQTKYVYLSVIFINIFAPRATYTCAQAWCRGIRIISVDIYLSIQTKYVYLSVIFINIFAPRATYACPQAWCRGIRIISVDIYLSIQTKSVYLSVIIINIFAPRGMYACPQARCRDIRVISMAISVHLYKQISVTLSHEQALVSLKLKKSVDAEGGGTFAVIIEGG